MSKKLDPLGEKIEELHRQWEKDGTLLSDEELKEIWPQDGELYELGNFGKRLRGKKEKKVGPASRHSLSISLPGDSFCVRWKIGFKYMEKPNLKPKQHYIDLYDRHTVERCRDLIRSHSRPMKNPPLIDGKKPSKEMVDTAIKMTLDLRLLFEKGDRYIRKEETVERWMADDQAKDELYKSAKAPEGIRCLICKSSIQPIDKTLWSEGIDGPDRVLFMYECPNRCRPMRSFYHDGEEWRYDPEPCPECKAPLDSEGETTEEKFITRYACPECNFTKTDEFERTANKEERPDPNFVADRTRFCLSEEEGERWRMELVDLKQMGKLVDGWKENEKNKDLHEKVAKIKKLSIAGIEKLLGPILEKDGYKNLRFSKPEFMRGLQVEFSIQDDKPDRHEYDSRIDLQRLIKRTLSDSNWKLMSAGVTYHLGFLTGRITGVESEEDLKKLVESRHKLQA